MANRENEQCATDRPKIILKLSLVIIIGIVVFIYTILILKGDFAKAPSTAPVKSTDPIELKAANKKIETLLTNNKYGFIKEYKEKDGYLEIKIVNMSWKKLGLKAKKSFLKDLAYSRGAIGLNPNIKVIDYKSSIEYASFENNRVALAELDF